MHVENRENLLSEGCVTSQADFHMLCPASTQGCETETMSRAALMLITTQGQLVVAIVDTSRSDVHIFKFQRSVYSIPSRSHAMPVVPSLPIVTSRRAPPKNKGLSNAASLPRLNNKKTSPNTT